MRLPILAYYILFVILFIYSPHLEAESTHTFYFQSSGTGQILLAKDARYSAEGQIGGILEQGILYTHSSGVTAGLVAGAGTYAQAITKEYAVYRGFDYYNIGVSAGYSHEFQNFHWLSLLEINGIVSRFDASVQEFFYPNIRLINGFGLGHINKIYATIPLTVQFRSDLALTVSAGIGFKLLLNLSPSLFREEKSKEETT